jgi:hypothetical protein
MSKPDWSAFWKGLEEMFGVDVEPPSELLLPLMAALEAEGLSKARVRLVVLAVRRNERAEMGRMIGNLATDGLGALWQKLGGRRLK